MTGLPKLTFADTKAVNPAFDGVDFATRWARRLGSVHRHYQTKELVLLYPRSGFREDERKALQAELEADAGNVGAVLVAIDHEREEWERKVRAGIFQ